MCVFRMYVCERSRKRVRIRMCAWASAYGRMYACKCERVYVCLFVDKGWVCLFGCVCVHNRLMHVRSFVADAPLLLDARALFFADGPLWVVSRRALTWGQGFVLTAHSGLITTGLTRALLSNYFMSLTLISNWQLLSHQLTFPPGHSIFSPPPLAHPTSLHRPNSYSCPLTPINRLRRCTILYCTILSLFLFTSCYLRYIYTFITCYFSQIYCVVI